MIKYVKGQQQSRNIVAEFKEVMLLLTTVFAQRAAVLIWALLKLTRVEAISLQPPKHPASQPHRWRARPCSLFF